MRTDEEEITLEEFKELHARLKSAVNSLWVINRSSDPALDEPQALLRNLQTNPISKSRSSVGAVARMLPSPVPILVALAFLGAAICCLVCINCGRQAEK